jgi:hypothetical protein
MKYEVYETHSSFLTGSGKKITKVLDKKCMFAILYSAYSVLD